MNALRQQLQREAPELSAALQRSWDIAQAEWLPSVTPSEGSYNSLPHFQNVESHLDALFAVTAQSPAVTLKLTPLELYLLLASVLFHDYGRVYGNDDHAYASARALPEHSTSLGIPTSQLAASLARIAVSHDPLTEADKMGGAEEKGRRLQQVRNSLREVHIEPFGKARELCVGLLLSLADHMDGSERRAVPRYIIPDEEVGFKGAFRRLISGTCYDPATLTLKTALCGFEDSSNHFLYDDLYSKFTIKYRDDGNQTKGRDIKANERKLSSKGCDLLDKMYEAWRDSLTDKQGIAPSKKPSKVFDKCLKARLSGANGQRKIERKLALVQTEAAKAIPMKGLWPGDYLIATVLNDLGANRGFLKGIVPDLVDIGLPVEGWFVEFKSEVFGTDGERDSENILKPQFLKRIASEMWDFGSRLLTPEYISYDALANSLRIENVALVRLAVQRIARLSDRTKLVHAGPGGWHWQKPAAPLGNRLDKGSALEIIFGSTISPLAKRTSD